MSISIVVGDNGVVTQAQKASKQTKTASDIESLEMAYSSAYTDYLTDSSMNANIDRNIYFTKEKLNTYLESWGQITEFEDNGDGSTTVSYKSNGQSTDALYTIESNGKVTAGGSFEMFGEPNEILKSRFGETIIEDAEIGNWQLFYADNDNAYLIYAYARYPVNNLNSYDNIEYSTTNNTIYLNLADSNNGTTREALLAYFKDTTYWKKVVNNLGEKLGVFDQIKVWGSATISLWISSYNAKYGTKLGYKKETGERYMLTSNVNTNSVIWNSGINAQYLGDGYADEENMYFPSHSSSGNYWIASLCSNNWNALIAVGGDGDIGLANYNNTGFGLRPVVRVPVSCIPVN